MQPPHAKSFTLLHATRFQQLLGVGSKALVYTATLPTPINGHTEVAIRQLHEELVFEEGDLPLKAACTQVQKVREKLATLKNGAEFATPECWFLEDNNKTPIVFFEKPGRFSLDVTTLINALWELVPWVWNELESADELSKPSGEEDMAKLKAVREMLVEEGGVTPTNRVEQHLLTNEQMFLATLEAKAAPVEGVRFEAAGADAPAPDRDRPDNHWVDKLASVLLAGAASKKQYDLADHPSLAHFLHDEVLSHILSENDRPSAPLRPSLEERQRVVVRLVAMLAPFGFARSLFLTGSQEVLSFVENMRRVKLLHLDISNDNVVFDAEVFLKDWLRARLGFVEEFLARKAAQAQLVEDFKRAGLSLMVEDFAGRWEPRERSDGGSLAFSSGGSSADGVFTGTGGVRGSPEQQRRRPRTLSGSHLSAGTQSPSLSPPRSPIRGLQRARAGTTSSLLSSPEPRGANAMLSLSHSWKSASQDSLPSLLLSSPPGGELLGPRPALSQSRRSTSSLGSLVSGSPFGGPPRSPFLDVDGVSLVSRSPPLIDEASEDFAQRPRLNGFKIIDFGSTLPDLTNRQLDSIFIAPEFREFLLEKKRELGRTLSGIEDEAAREAAVSAARGGPPSGSSPVEGGGVRADISDLPNFEEELFERLQYADLYSAICTLSFFLFPHTSGARESVRDLHQLLQHIGAQDAGRKIHDLMTFQRDLTAKAQLAETEAWTQLAETEAWTQLAETEAWATPFGDLEKTPEEEEVAENPEEEVRSSSTVEFQISGLELDRAEDGTEFPTTHEALLPPAVKKTSTGGNYTTPVVSKVSFDPFSPEVSTPSSEPTGVGSDDGVLVEDTSIASVPSPTRRPQSLSPSTTTARPPVSTSSSSPGGGVLVIQNKTTPCAADKLRLPCVDKTWERLVKSAVTALSPRSPAVSALSPMVAASEASTGLPSEFGVLPSEEGDRTGSVTQWSHVEHDRMISFALGGGSLEQDVGASRCSQRATSASPTAVDAVARRRGSSTSASPTGRGSFIVGGRAGGVPLLPPGVSHDFPVSRTERRAVVPRFPSCLSSGENSSCEPGFATPLPSLRGGPGSSRDASPSPVEGGGPRSSSKERRQTLRSTKLGGPEHQFPKQFFETGLHYFFERLTKIAGEHLNILVRERQMKTSEEREKGVLVDLTEILTKKAAIAEEVPQLVGRLDMEIKKLVEEA